MRLHRKEKVLTDVIVRQEDAHRKGLSPNLLRKGSFFILPFLMSIFNALQKLTVQINERLSKRLIRIPSSALTADLRGEA